MKQSDLKTVRASLEEEQRILLSEMEELSHQLYANPKSRKDANGLPLSHKDYKLWRRATQQKRNDKRARLGSVKRALAEIELRMERDQRLEIIEAKLDLLLKHFDLRLPSGIDLDIRTDAHGTPWEDAMHRRLPGSFESRQR